MRKNSEPFLYLTGTVIRTVATKALGTIMRSLGQKPTETVIDTINVDGDVYSTDNFVKD